MKSQQQGSHSKRNGKICTHIATLQDHAIKDLRSVGFCLNYATLVARSELSSLVTQGTCTVRIHSLPPDRLALLS